jgi:DNA-binding transcriptional MerR regulator
VSTPDAAPPLDPADQALAAALTAAAPPAEPAGTYTRADAAARAGVPESLLEAMEREGLLAPDAGSYTDDDLAVLRAGLELLDAGLPLAELLHLARRFDQAMRPVADEAVELFVRFVRDPIRASEPDAAVAATRMLDAFARMLPATSAVVGHHFRQVLLDAGRERLRRELEQP